MSPAAAEAGEEEFTRLHITPFDADLVKTYLPASVLPQARNISFHTIETFPEKRYGFVDLPTMDADKIKKKLNGATLKGTKVKIDKARPEIREEPEDVNGGEEETKADKKKRKKSKSTTDTETEGEKKKRKREVDVLDGVALTDRKVKRGWTETPEEAKKKKVKRSKEYKDSKAKSKKKAEDGEEQDKKDKKDKNAARKRLTSKYTEGEECLLTTKIPPNAVKNLSKSEESSSKKKKKDKGGRQVTIHEFEKTTKFPSFLKASVPEGDRPAAATEFVEGKGWVDEEGNVVEEVKEGKRDIIPKPKKKEKKQKKREVTPEESSESEDEAEPAPEPVPEPADDTTSSSGSSSEEEDSDSDSPSDAESEDEVATPQKPAPSSATKPDARPVSSSSAHSLTIQIPPPITPSATKIHPLEALYKRTKAEANATGQAVTETPAQEDAPFSFFGGAAGSDIEEDGDVAMPTAGAPMTPYTRQDFEWRATRSAAPTPDTAHPSRVQNFWAHDVEAAVNEEEEVGGGEEGYDYEDQDMAGAMNVDGGEEGGDKSDFQKWFWENRGDLNRSWMKRKKMASKEKRHRENKARASKTY